MTARTSHEARAAFLEHRQKFLRSSEDRTSNVDADVEGRPRRGIQKGTREDIAGSRLALELTRRCPAIVGVASQAHAEGTRWTPAVYSATISAIVGQSKHDLAILIQLLGHIHALLKLNDLRRQYRE